nr:hypothetical protein [Tanacetum cinerariifolium]
MSKIGELRAISGHVLGASRVQIPQDDLDNLQSIREKEDGATEVSDPRDVPGSILLAVIDFTTLGEDAIISPMDREYSTEKFMSKIGELRAISGHVLGASRVQIPQDDLDNLQSIREKEDGATEVSDPRDVPGSILLAVIDFTTL